MEAMDVPFHMGYGGPICSKRLQSDRPKWKGLLVEGGSFLKGERDRAGTESCLGAEGNGSLRSRSH